MPVVREHEMPVIYYDWAEWRFEQALAVVGEPLVAPGISFCFTCAGNGRIYEWASNGEGLIPTPCAWCLGRGWVGGER
jgi:hypothetical protein